MNALQELLGEEVPKEVEEPTLPKKKGFDLFRVLDDICTSRTPELLKEKEETGVFPKGYNQYMINMALGNNPDTVLFANEMNTRTLPDEMHYRFLFSALEKKKRYSRWFRVDEKKKALVEDVSVFYGVSQREARMYLRLLSPDDQKEIQEKLHREEKN